MNCNELQEGAKPSRYVIKRPKALQWFYNGRLYKESDEERQAGRFELFLDLLCTVSLYFRPIRFSANRCKTSQLSPTLATTSPSTPTARTWQSTCSYSRRHGTSGRTCARS